MSLRVAITRTLPEAEATASRVRALGAEAIVAPLLHIAARAFDADVAGAQAVLFTSANAVVAFAGATGARHIKAFTVGDATAQAAREAGFAAVRSAAGDVDALAALVTEALDPHAGPLVHIAGTHVAGDLAGALTNAGFTYRRRVAYEAIAVAALPNAYAEALDIILFHSARAAETYLRLDAPRAQERIAGCLSEAVAATARAASWRRVIVAPAPREEALLAATLGGQNSPGGASA